MNSSVGTTVYLTESKQWHAATVATFDFQSKKEDSETKVGNAMNLEGGLGADFLKGGLTTGLNYYASFKLTDDQIEGIPGILIRGKNKVFALGPEVQLALATKNTVYGFLKVNYQWEVYARTAPQGSALTILARFLMKPHKLTHSLRPQCAGFGEGYFRWVSGRGVSSDGLARGLRHGRCDRNPHADLGTFVRFGHNTKSSLRKPDALAHAHEAKASALPPRSGSIEPLAIVHDREFDAVAVAEQMDLSPPRSRVFDNVMQRLLSDPVQGERRSPNRVRRPPLQRCRRS